MSHPWKAIHTRAAGKARYRTENNHAALLVVDADRSAQRVVTRQPHIEVHQHGTVAPVCVNVDLHLGILVPRAEK